MKSILITGSDGFVGRNLRLAFKNQSDVEILTFDVGDAVDSLSERVLKADVIVHLAGVNRPEKLEEFETGNAGLTETLTQILMDAGRNTPVILSSSSQAALENPYGLSKRAAEQTIFRYGEKTGARVYVYRLPNVFGKWCRPNYNSAVATFCYNVARDLPIQVNDPSAPLTLLYIDDLLEEFLRALEGNPTRNGAFCVVPVIHETTVGEAVGLIQSFKASRSDLSCPSMGDPLALKLYSTYLSSLPEDGFSYPLTMRCDHRGSFTEFLRTPERGQMSVNISRPGITKGNHWHHTKNEKFLVVSGRGVIRFRKLETDQVIDYPVSGEKLEVVDIPPGYTHNITNLGDSDMVTLMWVNQPFDPAKPDTWYEDV